MEDKTSLQLDVDSSWSSKALQALSVYQKPIRIVVFGPVIFSALSYVLGFMAITIYCALIGLDFFKLIPVPSIVFVGYSVAVFWFSPVLLVLLLTIYLKGLAKRRSKTGQQHAQSTDTETNENDSFAKAEVKKVDKYLRAFLRWSVPAFFASLSYITMMSYLAFVAFESEAFIDIIETKSGHQMSGTIALSTGNKTAFHMTSHYVLSADGVLSGIKYEGEVDGERTRIRGGVAVIDSSDIRMIRNYVQAERPKERGALGLLTIASIPFR